MWPIVHSLYSLVAIGSRNKGNALHGRIGNVQISKVMAPNSVFAFVHINNPWVMAVVSSSIFGLGLLLGVP